MVTITQPLTKNSIDFSSQSRSQAKTNPNSAASAAKPVSSISTHIIVLPPGESSFVAVTRGRCTPSNECYRPRNQMSVKTESRRIKISSRRNREEEKGSQAAERPQQGRYRFRTSPTALQTNGMKMSVSSAEVSTPSATPFAIGTRDSAPSLVSSTDGEHPLERRVGGHQVGV